MKRALIFLTSFLAITAVYLFAWPVGERLVLRARLSLHLLAGIAFLVVLIFTLRPILAGGARQLSRLGWLLLALGGILGAVVDLYRHAARGMATAVRAHRRLRRGMCVSCFRLGLQTRLPREWLCLQAYFGAHCAWLAAALIAAGRGGCARFLGRNRTGFKIRTIAPATMDSEGDGPQGPFFPSSAQTA